MKRKTSERFLPGVDRQGRVRRECPACHRIFQIRAGELEAAAVLRAVARELPHANELELGDALPDRYCPYCAAKAPADAWLTAAQRRAVGARAKQWRCELRYAQLLQPRQTLAQNPFITYLAVPPKVYEQPVPETGGGLQAFPLVCCRDEVRILKGWRTPVSCHFCGVANDRGESAHVLPEDGAANS